ncbi:NAD-dependent epimerase/dehydratase family protein [Haloterrigena sp. SYSU A558-1]|uniref:NAD-dependent epimerase/dehydratase family protein n=1 Tax=Haloterrigena gelatinilytica TaxID=2741724 RepID=A0A8J8KH91_9EURY|nr:NAD-dependent epimerase/dehydratase family protein [Haloterrigena gelatinilytica]NUB93296.1 NAD-dependent epimerase/dehydratase family protein [Haloterrigena gelatinilytica]NUC70799.1 NAD-dependent epimerase/dehydratase family protein [Haloterrigena gelatinilytica]
MELSNGRVLVTGGAGFIGSHLTERLLADGVDVTIVDDLSNGDAARVPEDATFVDADLTEPGVLDGRLDDVDLVFHLAASKHVDTDRPHGQFDDNTRMTRNILESMADAGVAEIAYTSSSTVYGEAPRPTPEDYAPLEPISAYGASKLADEGLLSARAHSHDLTVWNFRFANVVGPRLRGAVIPDFIEKLQDDPETLTILGDGRQEKSYLDVEDCLDAMLHVVEHADDAMNTYNLGTRTTTSVDRIAAIVADEMDLEPEFEYTGGERGWTGDVPKMRLSIEKLSALGWEPTRSSDEAVRRATREILAELN